MFLSWRKRCEAVWAMAWSMGVLSSRYSANWLTALLLLLLTPLAYILQACGEAWRAYGHRTAHLQCLAHKELGALTHRHARSLAHHHHGRGAHGQGAGSFEHGEVWSGEWRVECRWMCKQCRHRSLTSGARQVGGCSPAIAESLIGCVESKRSQPIAILTTSLTT